MSIYNTAVNKPISTLRVFVAIMVLGVASYIQLPVDQYPKMDPPLPDCNGLLTGANASDIEENVTKILEDQLNSVDNLKELTSTSYDNLAVVSLEFEWEANLDEASNDVRDAVDKAMQNLPDDIDRPTIMRFNTSMMPILIYAITADQSYPGIDKILDDKFNHPAKPGRRGCFSNHFGCSGTCGIRGPRSEQTGCLQPDSGTDRK